MSSTPEPRHDRSAPGASEASQTARTEPQNPGWLTRWRGWMTAPPRGLTRPLLGVSLALVGIAVMVLAVVIGRSERDDWHPRDPATPWPRAAVLERPHTVLTGGMPLLRAAAVQTLAQQWGAACEMVDLGGGAMLLRAEVPSAGEWPLRRDLGELGIDWPGGALLVLEFRAENP